MAETPEDDAPKTPRGKTTLAVGWPADSFTVGDVTITGEGTDVPTADAADLITAAGNVGVLITKVS